MKKLIKLATLLLGMAMLFMSATACSVVSNKANSGTTSNVSENSATTQTITVYKEETPITYTVKYGEVAQIDIFTKQGYYFVGAYDSPEGGKKYFDGNGSSTVVWGVGNPETYYARFEDISAIQFTQAQHQEDPASFLTGGLTFTFEFDQALKNAILANLDENLSVKISFDAINSDSWQMDAYLTNLKTGGEKYDILNATKLDKNQYLSFEKEFKIPARQLQNGNMYLRVETGAIINGNKYYSVKNIMFSISFEKTGEPV